MPKLLELCRSLSGIAIRGPSRLTSALLNRRRHRRRGIRLAHMVTMAWMSARAGRDSNANPGVMSRLLRSR